MQTLITSLGSSFPPLCSVPYALETGLLPVQMSHALSHPGPACTRYPFSWKIALQMPPPISVSTSTSAQPAPGNACQGIPYMLPLLPYTTSWHLFHHGTVVCGSISVSHCIKLHESRGPVCCFTGVPCTWQGLTHAGNTIHKCLLDEQVYGNHTLACVINSLQSELTTGYQNTLKKYQDHHGYDLCQLVSICTQEPCSQPHRGNTVAFIMRQWQEENGWWK